MTITVNQDYYLELNGIALACPAWEVTNVWTLLEDMDVRGDDRTVGGASGRTALKRVKNSRIYTLSFECYGDMDTDGTPVVDSGTKLMAHMDYLKANLGFVKATGDGTVPAIFHRGATAHTMTADVHFLGFKGAELSPPAFLRTTFDISVPYGWVVTP